MTETDEIPVWSDVDTGVFGYSGGTTYNSAGVSGTGRINQYGLFTAEVAGDVVIRANSMDGSGPYSLIRAIRPADTI